MILEEISCQVALVLTSLLQASFVLLPVKVGQASKGQTCLCWLDVGIHCFINFLITLSMQWQRVRIINNNNSSANFWLDCSVPCLHQLVGWVRKQLACLDSIWWCLLLHSTWWTGIFNRPLCGRLLFCHDWLAEAKTKLMLEPLRISKQIKWSITQTVEHVIWCSGTENRTQLPQTCLHTNSFLHVRAPCLSWTKGRPSQQPRVEMANATMMIQGNRVAKAMTIIAWLRRRCSYDWQGWLTDQRPRWFEPWTKTICQLLPTCIFFKPSHQVRRYQFSASHPNPRYFHRRCHCQPSANH